MRGFMITATALCLLAFPGMLAAQEEADPDHVLEATRASGDIGDTVEIEITYSNAGDPINTYEWGMCHDEDVASIEAEDIVNGDVVDDANFFFHSLVMADGGWKIAGVLDNFGEEENTLPTGSNQLMYTCTYSLDAGGNTGLEFCDTVADPPPNIAVYVGDEAILPLTIDGKINVFDPNSPFWYTAKSVVVAYEPEDGEAIFDVDLTIEENPENDGFPQEVRAVQMGLAHDGAVLTANEVTRGSAVDDLNGGEGPDFWGPSLEPPLGVGLTIGIIVSFSSDDALIFDGETVVATVEYEADSDLLTDNEVGVFTELVWDDQLEDDPEITNNVFVGGEIIEGTRLVDGLVELDPGGGVVFLRGDANSSGDVSGLGDGLFMLNFQFIDGSPAPLCDDAADANSDNAITGLGDGLFLLRWQFIDGAPAPAAPGVEECGPDPDEDTDLGCEVPPDC